MKDAYSNAFYGIVRETQEKHGYALPEHLESYIVMLLSFYVDRPNFAPEDSFAEAYLRLKHPARTDAKTLGDTCLFVSGVFPTYGERRGLRRSYYQSIGVGSYEMVAEVMHRDLFTQLAIHFHLLSDFIEAVTHSPRHVQSNLFR